MSFSFVFSFAVNMRGSKHFRRMIAKNESTFLKNGLHFVLIRLNYFIFTDYK